MEYLQNGLVRKGKRERISHFSMFQLWSTKSRSRCAWICKKRVEREGKQRKRHEKKVIERERGREGRQKRDCIFWASFSFLSSVAGEALLEAKEDLSVQKKPLNRSKRPLATGIWLVWTTEGARWSASAFFPSPPKRFLRPFSAFGALLSISLFDGFLPS